MQHVLMSNQTEQSLPTGVRQTEGATVGYAQAASTMPASSPPGDGAHFAPAPASSNLTVVVMAKAPVALRHCDHKDCNRRPSFNYPGLRARFCSQHRERTMVDVAHKTRCQHREVMSHEAGLTFLFPFNFLICAVPESAETCSVAVRMMKKYRPTDMFLVYVLSPPADAVPAWITEPSRFGKNLPDIPSRGLHPSPMCHPLRDSTTLPGEVHDEGLDHTEVTCLESVLYPTPSSRRVRSMDHVDDTPTASISHTAPVHPL